MGRPLRFTLCAGLAAAVASAQAPPLTRGDKQIQLALHPAGMSAKVAERLVDGCWQAADKLNVLLKKLRRPKKGPRIELYVDEAAYRAMEKQHNPHAFHASEFCDATTCTVHIALPKLPDASYDALGAPSSIRQSIIRLAARLVALQHGIGRNDPWLADVVSYAVLDELENPNRTWGIDPLFDQRGLILKQRTKTG